MSFDDRRVSELHSEAGRVLGWAPAGRLSSFRNAGVYVLLGDPGMGKTTAFEHESAEAPDARFLSVRDFLTLPPGSGGSAPETLFLDGLDEVRAAEDDPRRPFDRLRERLGALGRPRFRLSCRPLEWLGDDDRDRLKVLSSDGKVAVLRLEPLKKTEITAFLEARAGFTHPVRWFEAASDRGVETLIGNPLTLRLLAEAAGSGEDWPESRRDTFELACRRLVVERNPQYRIRPAKPHQTEALLNAAGELSARLLLCGASGFVLPPYLGDEDYLPLDEQAADPRSEYRVALASRLFAGGTESRLEPVHRLIAEYLAARYLTSLVADGFPRLRLFALVTGGDGFPPTSLRGLAAWLATLSLPLRPRLTAADPYAVARYGDLDTFSLDERRSLLDRLRQRPEHSPTDARSGLADQLLTAPDLLDEVVEMFRSDSRTPSEEAALQFVLPSLPKSLPDELADELLRTATDPSRPEDTRRLAAKAFVESAPPAADDDLLCLLRRIRAGEVADPQEYLRGQLLKRLYPHRVPPAEVWDYLPRGEYGRESGTRFWSRDLLERSSPSQIAELLDSLSRETPLSPFDWVRQAAVDLPMRLLLCGLDECGEEVEVARLHDWLRVGVFEKRWGKFWPQDASGVRDWLTARPEVQKAVVREALERLDDSNQLACEMFDEKRILYGAVPPDYGKFCLDLAASWAQVRPNTARRLLGDAVNAMQSGVGMEGLTLDALFDCVGATPPMASWISPMLMTELGDGYFLSLNRDIRERADRNASVNRWLGTVQSTLDSLKDNCAPPRLMYELGRAFYGSLPGSEGSDPEERYRRLFRGDQEMIEGAWRAIRGTPDRTDIPSVNDIISACERRRRKEESTAEWLAPAFLGAARDAAQSAPGGIPAWTEERLRQLLAFEYTRPAAAVLERDLAHRVAAEHPALAAEVLVEFVRAELLSGGEPTDLCRDLDRDERLREAARLAVPPLLRAFPTRAAARQLSSLEWLLRATISHDESQLLRSIIAKKAKSRTMPSAQRVLWLAAGIVVAPDEYISSISDALNEEPERAVEAVDFLASGLPERFPILYSRFDARVLAILVRGLGRVVEPRGGMTSSISSWPSFTRAKSQLGQLIGWLENNPTAGAELDALVADDTLEAWRPALEAARERQRPLARDAAFRHPSPEELRKALADGPPTSAADLAALVADRLLEIGDELQGGDANSWRLFWNETSGSTRAPTEPKHEDSCRDALLSLLRGRLPEGVKVWPEGRYADDRRSDLRVTYGDYAVPVEIKKNEHSRVWSAAHRQLAARYATDPAAEGYGIYLVLWMKPEKTPGAPEGRRPRTPKEMEERLRKELTRDGLSPTDARKITICILDVRRPRDQES